MVLRGYRPARARHGARSRGRLEVDVSEPLTLLCVHPHPDDESIACGGALARASAHGIRTVVVTCTGGEEGENLSGIDLGDDDLVDHRRRELADAVDILDVDAHHWLGYRDSGMVGTPANTHPDSFHAADLDEAALRLAAIIRAERPQVVVSDDEQGSYGHPDHIKANRVTARAVALAADAGTEVPGEPWRVAKRYVHAFGADRLRRVHEALLAEGFASPFGPDLADSLEFGVPEEQVTTEVNVRPWLKTKREAMAAHRSQIGPDSFFFNLPERHARLLFGVEQFVLREGEPGIAGRRETDLFDGIAGHPADGPTRADFRAVLGRFATGVGVLTTRVGDTPHGMTVNALTSVSLDPLLVLVCVERSSTMVRLLETAGVFGISLLPEGAAGVSAWFADPGRPAGEAQFAEVAVRAGGTGVPLLADNVGWIECHTWATHDGGDHVIVVGEVVDLGVGASDAPLVYHRGGYVGLARD
jgi:N-acetyl-1-D-myo-inositol-2-amino-2-deoxy-alpha-D-glucopyranoside deacetylase